MDYIKPKQGLVTWTISRSTPLGPNTRWKLILPEMISDFPDWEVEGRTSGPCGVAYLVLTKKEPN